MKVKHKEILICPKCGNFCYLQDERRITVLHATGIPNIIQLIL